MNTAPGGAYPRTIRWSLKPIQPGDRNSLSPSAWGGEAERGTPKSSAAAGGIGDLNPLAIA
jgi:hypothetical protein